jgi:hypothetical protein
MRLVVLALCAGALAYPLTMDAQSHQASSTVRLEPTAAEVSRGRQIVAQLHARHPFIQLMEFGGLTDNVSLMLPIPTSAWRRLSTSDKAALVRYVGDAVSRARAHPGEYMTTPPSAPAYDAIRSKVAKIRDGHWQIMGGTLVGGDDMDEGDVLACGDELPECDDARSASTLLAAWSR